MSHFDVQPSALTRAEQDFYEDVSDLRRMEAQLASCRQAVQTLSQMQGVCRSLDVVLENTRRSRSRLQAYASAAGRIADQFDKTEEELTRRASSSGAVAGSAGNRDEVIVKPGVKPGVIPTRIPTIVIPGRPAPIPILKPFILPGSCQAKNPAADPMTNNRGASAVVMKNAVMKIAARIKADNLSRTFVKRAEGRMAGGFSFKVR